MLARAFHEDGHQVVVLSRRPERRPWRVVSWVHYEDFIAAVR
jgi:hypothetical protein